MRKFISLVGVAFMATSALAQSAAELAKQQAELNALHMKVLNIKPTKDAKKEAKKLSDAGWSVPAGEKSIEQQITESQLYGAELTTNASGATIKRFIMHTSVQTAGTYNSGYAAARASAQVELATMLKTRITTAMKSGLDNSQTSEISATTVDKFNQRAHAIVDDETLNNLIPVLAIYRRLENGNFEVQVRIALDKKELGVRLKQKMQKELENEGDELNKILEDIISNS